jgi:hypothetical protein
MKIPFIGQAYSNRSIQVASQICINWYPEVEQNDARNVVTLQTCSGIELFAEISSGKEVRGLLFSEYDQVLYAVIDDVFYVFEKDGSYSSKGSVDGNGIVSIAENGASQVAISTGESYWVYDETGLSKVADAGAVSDVVFQDDYIVFTRTDTGRFGITDINDARSINPLDEAATGANPDKLVGLVQVERRIWLFGTDSIEIWYNSGNAGFPFTRVDGGSSNGFGLAGKDAKVLQDSVVYWLSNDGRIYYSNGYTPQRASHQGIENSIRTYDDISDCEASQWTENGHKFIAFSFPSAGATWVFDSTTGMWHERSSGLKDAVWRARLATRAWGFNLVGDRDSGKLGILSLDLFTEYDDIMVARRKTPVVHADQNVFFTDRLEIVMEVGQTDRQGFNPKASLRWSDDGGLTWGNWLNQDIGGIGDYRERLVWYRLGQAQNRVYDLRITDNVRRTLIDCVIEGEVGYI